MPETLAHHLETLSGGSVIRIAGDVAIEVTAPFVESDRDLQPGGVFVARKGHRVDGHDYIENAVERGAVAVIGERAIDTQGLFGHTSYKINPGRTPNY